MKEILFTIREDICAKTGRDPDATELIEVMKNYGTVEEFDSVENRVRQEYQKTLDNLTAQYNAIKEQELSESELKIINTLRECKQSDEQLYLNKIAELEKAISDKKADTKNAHNEITVEEERVAGLMNFIGGEYE